MTSVIRPVAALMCDDIRHEIGGAYTLIGVATPVLQFSDYPVRRRLSIALILHADTPGEALITASLVWKGETRWAAETEIEVEMAGSGALLPLPSTIAVLDEPGTLLLRVEIDGEIFDVQSWQIEKQVGDSE